MEALTSDELQFMWEVGGEYVRKAMSGVRDAVEWSLLDWLLRPWMKIIFLVLLHIYRFYNLDSTTEAVDIPSKVQTGCDHRVDGLGRSFADPDTLEEVCCVFRRPHELRH